ncbi:hypothetical protein OCL06_14875 [Alteromonas sp. ASW11-19]|uniref:Uncharacterized protein n=1 Tax=Alteromonas salexigens TaxID=2982530 RepID=A0ABT2VSH7_9ALTE|nr:hypothetical protein [Alteromonas salexigens]MCU7555872.1 hypothetical protein [Alteromonas salexigens]
MLFDPRNPNELVNVRNVLVPDVFPVVFEGQEYFVHISPYVWLRPWEGKEHTGYSVGLVAGCPNACRAFGSLEKGYLECSLEDIEQAALERIATLGSGFFTSKSAGITSLAEYHSPGYTLVNEADEHKKAYDKGYRYIVHVYQLRSAGMRNHVCDWYFYGKPQREVVLNRLRQNEGSHPDAMHFEVNELRTDLSASA